jgi:hypothetical protein
MTPEQTLAEIERLANDHRDGWLEVRHTDDDDQYRLAIEEGLKWEQIGALARAHLTAA